MGAWRKLRWYLLALAWFGLTGWVVLIAIMVAVAKAWWWGVPAVGFVVGWVYGYFALRTHWRRQEFEPERRRYESWVHAAVAAVTSGAKPAKPEHPRWLTWAIEQGYFAVADDKLALGQRAARVDPIPNPFDLPSEERRRADHDVEEAHAAHSAAHFWHH
jgi:hypothetical protein